MANDEDVATADQGWDASQFLQSLAPDVPRRSLWRCLAWRLVGVTFLMISLSMAALSDTAGLAVCLYIATSCFAHGRRWLALNINRFVPNDPKSVVLYLRPFSYDEKAFKSLGFSGTEEEQLKSALRNVGPVVTLGMSGETRSYPGAERIYIQEIHWKNIVMQLMQYARLIVIRLGKSEGVIWELEQASIKCYHDRLVLLVPENRKIYSEVRACLAGRLELPEFPRVHIPWGPIAGIITFKEGGRACFEAIPQPFCGGNPIRLLPASLGLQLIRGGYVSFLKIAFERSVARPNPSDNDLHGVQQVRG